jgi:glutamine amidotransferase-like uncharacterized protein
MRSIAQACVGLCAFLIILSLSRCQDEQDNTIQGPPVQAPDDTVRIALYSDRGCWDESIRAAGNMFAWMGHEASLITAEDIKNNSLDSFSLLCIPGGDMYRYAQSLSTKGIGNIKSFIYEGGGYIGICGGAYFAGEKVYWLGSQLPMGSLGLFSGRTEGPKDEIVPYPAYDMSRINIADTAHPIIETEADSAWILYYWGPVLLPDADAGVAVLGRYEKTDLPAILAFDHGCGRVFLVGTHPEIEEDSERDGVTFADELDDRGSDWELMKKATLWCLKK